MSALLFSFLAAIGFSLYEHSFWPVGIYIGIFFVSLLLMAAGGELSEPK